MTIGKDFQRQSICVRCALAPNKGEAYTNLKPCTIQIMINTKQKIFALLSCSVCQYRRFCFSCFILFQSYSINLFHSILLISNIFLPSWKSFPPPYEKISYREANPDNHNLTPTLPNTRLNSLFIVWFQEISLLPSSTCLFQGLLKYSSIFPFNSSQVYFISAHS